MTLRLLFAWFLLNLLQAGLTPLDPDETYYWMYADDLAWGYFDHPPAVALLVALGKDWLPGALGLRFGHVLASTATIAGLWYLLGRPRGRERWLAAALVFAQPFLHVYGFIATPDGPLLLFTVLYLLAYRRFLRAPTLAHGALWGLTMAGLLYSKYHGVMLIFFTVLPALGWLLRRPGAWVAALGGAALYAPHLWWQYAHDFPSFRYHLSGRDDPYRFKYTTGYLLNQLVIFSPLLLPIYGPVLWRYREFFGARPRVRGEDTEAGFADRAFLRANYALVVGFLLFFLYTTTKGGTEAQWTALLSVPLCYLSFRWLTEERPDRAALAGKLGLATLGVLVVARLLLVAPRDWLPFPKPFDHQPWTERLAAVAGERPVLVQNSYRFASLYEFYTGRPAWTFTDVQYRRNQYDLWAADSAFHNRSVLVLGQGTWDRPAATAFRTQKRGMRFQAIDSFQVMKNVRFTDVAVPDTLRRGQPADFAALVTSPRSFRTDAGNLSLKPLVILHYPDEMRYWALSVAAETAAAGPYDRALSGTFRVFTDLPTGPAELEFGYGYAGMPPLRGQSRRIPVVVK